MNHRHIYVSIHRREQGVEVIRDFSLVISPCKGCFRRARYALLPVEEISLAPGAPPPVPVGDPLCKACCLSLPLLDPATRATWPVLTALEAESLWDMVRKEQVAQALELGRAEAPASRLQGFDGAPADPQQTARHQGIDRTGKVA